MAGYIFSLDSLDSLHRYTTNGVYGTKLSAPSHSWVAHHEGTFADYATMRAGDNIYFFIQRKIYGIGKLVNVGSDCKFFNFPEPATASPSRTYPYVRQFFGTKATLVLISSAFACSSPIPTSFET